MVQENKLKSPRELQKDKPEDERKHHVLGASWQEKAARLDEIFKFVAGEKAHFITLDGSPYAEDFDPELAAAARMPVNTRPLHRRIYWGTRDLDGYTDGAKAKAEIRTERKTGKGCWEQVLKLGGGAQESKTQESKTQKPKTQKPKTMSRREYERALDGFGVNLDVLPNDAKKAAETVLGGKTLKPLICLQGQGIPILYHPDGRADVLFEIKFDKGKGFAFDGEQTDIVEVEIELKENSASVTSGEIEALLDTSDALLYSAFPDYLALSSESKPAPLFYHLAAWRGRDPAGFNNAFDALPGNRWAEIPSA
ncbi:MAG: hypothetical protein O2912_09125 [Proteobacteria bacterium]|nr:hypothetical protein [Pseudomonadota bacterium]